MTFPEKLKELRAKAGLSQSELADKSEMSLSAIHDYEQGKREPSLRFAVKLAGALGVDCRAFAECMGQGVAKVPAKRTLRSKKRGK